jgi:hypothetical protein
MLIRDLIARRDCADKVEMAIIRWVGWNLNFAQDRCLSRKVKYSLAAAAWQAACGLFAWSSSSGEAFLNRDLMAQWSSCALSELPKLNI